MRQLGYTAMRVYGNRIVSEWGMVVCGVWWRMVVAGRPDASAAGEVRWTILASGRLRLACGLSRHPASAQGPPVAESPDAGACC